MSAADTPQGEALRRFVEACGLVVRAAAHALERRGRGTPAEAEAAVASFRRAVLAAVGVAEVLCEYLSGPRPEWPDDWGPGAN